ncbi:S53 family peptidase [Streptomyces sp. NBC_01477]|uniref:S53 family peptidase n=1 Tax=Streptomyces sp. NBC_01477 TaxID=2976015 RepID=UPI002E347750|nr:S53 family peptidase [Streptomyces sp. NBC_01477]
MGIPARDAASRTGTGAIRARSRYRSALPGGVVAATALAMVAAIAPVAAADSTPAPAPQRVGPAPTLPAGAVRTAAPAGDTSLDLSVVLSPRDPAGLKKFITDVSTPGSPLYHQYLKTGQFSSSFGATDATVARVRAALKTQGLTTGALESDGLTLPVHTTVGAAEKAFRTGFTGFRDREGRTGVTNTVAPSVQGDVAPAITAVTGLTTTAPVRSHLSVKQKKKFTASPSASGGTSVAPRINGKTPALCSSIKNGAAGIGWNDTQQYWSARSLAGAYGMADEPNVGTGVTVGIFELESYSAKDVAAYQSCYGTNVPVSAVKVDGGPKVAANASLFIGSESALDIEDLIGLVPQASLVVYQGPDITDAQGNPAPVTYQNILDVYQKMVTDNRAQVISTSWGSCEQDTSAPFMAAENLVFQQAAAQGQTVTAASGDSGSGDCAFNGTANSGALSVDDPASQPYVLGVGGTTMTGANGAGQSTWNDGYYGATGGGVSTYVTQDGTSGFQAGVNGPGYVNACETGTGQKCRQVPDVAALGDPNTGYLIANGQEPDGSQDWGIIGGTSGASPTWAALVAQADLDLSCAADGPVGWINPALYKLPATAFRDIVDGDNYLPTDDGPTSGYYAGTGYDLTTGLGTPKARSIIPALCKAVPQQPAGTFTSVNPARILDTRYHVGVSTTTPVKANSAVALQVTGAGGVNPPAGSVVTSVVLNTTAVSPTATGHLIAYPHGTTRPTSSNLNWLKGQIIPNLVTVPVGTGGKVDLYNASGGTVHFVADVFGYFSTSATGATYTPVGPARVLDTRSHIGTPTTTPVKSNSAVAVQIAGTAGVPATGASAVILNVTATAPTATGHLIAYPDGTTQPTSSNINWVKGETRPNLVVLPIGANGKVDLFNSSSGTVHFVADVFGYYSADSAGAKFHSAGPSRVLDTRYGNGAPAIGPLASTKDLSLNLNDGNVVTGAKAVVLNVTVANGTGSGVLTVWPDGAARPSSSSLNWTKGEIVANLVTVPVINGKVDFHVNAGSVAVIADLFGYYTN